VSELLVWNGLVVRLRRVIAAGGPTVTGLTEPPRPPLTEEQILASAVGELKPFESRIELADYDPEWPRLFEREAGRIRSILGERVLRIEHTGSTSVPGLPAKPIVDIVLEVADSADEGAHVTLLEAAGYRLTIREPEWHEHRLLKSPDTNINLHVFSQGSREIDRMVAFRDWLRQNDADRELYKQAKRELAQREWKCVQNYADAKSAVVEEILSRALGNR
jgi:GrpB-like predicted nucleotidyltransferase (UPF0157 family)